MPIRPVPIDADFVELEKEVLDRWRRERTFEQSLERRADAPRYVFYDGPPFATGLPHYGHILTSYIKDTVPRYFTMRGYQVPRRWGWDCHGLPVEHEVEKQHGFKSRSDVVDFGVGRFNDACRGAVARYTTEWRHIIERLGRWVDFDNDYKTMDPDYMESVVWAFKELWNRGLVYESQKVVAYCTRCQTPLSNFEARLDDAYREREDAAVTIRFRLSQDGSQAFLIWTTTPWTLPSNIALAVAPDADYVRMEKEGQSVWLAAAAVPRYASLLHGYTVAERAPGRALVDLRYEPVLPYFAGTRGAFRVLAADFVTADDGTGVVHLAPSFGEDDASACAAAGLVGPNPVRDNGTFDETVPDLTGVDVFAANDVVITKLQADGAVFKSERYVHDYPHCWRCDRPLIYRAITGWFVRVLQVKAEMIAANQQIRWVPDHVRDGRFGKWLENARDWSVSRNRFWGAPVPVWRCDRCGVADVIGSRSELEQKSGQRVTDWHRPAIDEVTWSCPCGGSLVRVPEVLDCWFESGAMPFAQMHYPFENKKEFEETFPGDFIVEYIAQTRGWFYTLVVEAAALFGDRPFKNVICHGVILGHDGRKMSKRLQNYPDPTELVETHGSDALRAALLSSPLARGADMRFSESAVKDAARRMVIPLWNCVHLFTTYAAIDGFSPSGDQSQANRLDRYLLSETDRLRETLEKSMAAYDMAACYDSIEAYINLLSTWYVRLARRRLWSPDPHPDKYAALETLHAALEALMRMIAPFLPFLTESIYGALGMTGSVHLQDWPVARPDWRDEALSAEMDEVRAIVGLARGVRETHRISHRQPLRSIAIANVAAHTIAGNRDLFLAELNVRDVRAVKSLQGLATTVVKLDYARLGKRLRHGIKQVQAAINAGEWKLTPDGTLVAAGMTFVEGEFHLAHAAANDRTGVASDGRVVVVLDLAADSELLAEKHARDLNRAIQNLRKSAGLAYDQRIRIGLVAPTPLVLELEPRRTWLAAETLATELHWGGLDRAEIGATVEIAGERIDITLMRV